MSGVVKWISKLTQSQSVEQKVTIVVQLKNVFGSLYETIPSSACVLQYPCVVPWYTLVIENEDPPTDKPFVQFARITKSQKQTVEELRDTYICHKNLRALLIFSNITQSSIRELTAPFPIIIVHLSYLEAFKKIVKASKEQQLLVSALPLSSAEVKLNSPEVVFVTDSDKYYIKLMKVVRESIQNDEIMSTSDRTILVRRAQVQRLLHDIIFLQHEIDMQEHIEMIKSLSREDDSILMNILLHRDNFEHFFCFDLPVYFVFVHWLYSASTMHRERCYEEFIISMFKALSLASITELTAGLESFVAKPDFPVRNNPLNGIESTISFIGEIILNIVEEWCRLVKFSSESCLYNLFVSVSISVRLFMASKQLAKADKIWSRVITNRCKDVRLSYSMVTELQSGLEAMNLILKDHPELMFSWNDYLPIMISSRYSLSFIRQSLSRIVEHLLRRNALAPFIESFLKPLTNHFQSELKKYGPNGIVESLGISFSEVFFEGIDFINYLNSLAKERKWNEVDLESIIFEWIDMLVDIINFRECEKATKLIAHMQQNRSGFYHVYFTSKVQDRIQEISDELQISQFMHFVNALPQDQSKDKLVQSYLDVCRTPNTLNDSAVINFFELCFSSCCDHHQLLILLYSTGENYSAKSEFVRDLVYLRTSKNHPFAGMVGESFKMDLHKFIEDNDLENDLSVVVQDIMPCLPLDDSFYHQMYAEALLQHLQRLFALPNQRKHFTTLLSNAHEALHTFNGVLGTRIIFAIEIVESFANSIKIEHSNIHWLRDHGEELFYLVKSYVFVRQEIQLATLNDKLCNLMECLHKAVKYLHGCIVSKSVIFDDLNTLHENYKFYHSIWDNLVSSESCFEGKIVKNMIDEYDKCVRDMNDLLFWKPRNYNPCSQFLTIPVLNLHGIEVPEYICKKMEKCLSMKYDRKYKPEEEAKLCDLLDLMKDFELYFDPVLQSIDTLLFMADQQCEILTKFTEFFKQCGGYSTAISSSTNIDSHLSLLNSIVQSTELHVHKLVHGQITLEEVLKMLGLHFLQNELNIELEVASTCSFLCMKLGKENVFNMDVLKEGLLAVVNVFGVLNGLKTLKETCEMFNLNICLNDNKMVEIKEIILEFDSDDMHSQITLQDVITKQHIIKQNLKIDNFSDTSIFKLISSIQNSTKLYHFCQERGFTSAIGMQNFISQLKLVTVAMQHEDYCDEILNHLRGAVQFMSPFFYEDCSLSQLMERLHNLKNLTLGISQLATVEANMNLIIVSFNRIEGETHELVTTTLKAILKSGKLIFYPNGPYNIQMVLEFFLLSEELSGTSLIRWNAERIEDFERKLGFHSAEMGGTTQTNDDQKCTGHSVKENSIALNPVKKEDEGCTFFIKFLKTGRRVLKVYTDLQYLGHFGLIKTHEQQFSVEELGMSRLEKESETSQARLKSLQEKTADARMKYKELSLISVPKLRRIYEKLLRKSCIANDLLDDLGLFFKCDINDIQQIRDVIDKCFSSFKADDYQQLCSAEATGSFLNIVLSNVNKSSIALSAVAEENNDSRKGRTISSFLLYTATDFTNLELIRLVFWIFLGAFPFSFQLLRCSKSTTKEQVELFFQRINMYPKFRYLIMGVNCLPMNVQKILTMLSSKMRLDVHGGAHNFQMPDVCFVEYAPSIFHNMPWMSVVKIDKANITEIQTVKQYLMKSFIKTRFKEFRIVKGLPGSGKTHFIQKQIKSSKYDGSTVLTIDETFNELRYIQLLQEIPYDHASFNRAVYINISLFLWETQNKNMDDFQTFCYNLADRINWFFFDYLILGYVEDYSSGFSLKFPDNTSRSFYIEVPFWEFGELQDSELKLEKSFQQFCEVLPVFSLLGRTERPSSDLDIFNDPGLHLVCKYIRRYDERKLDCLINPESSKPMKIGDDPPVAPESCRDYVERYIPSQLKRNKIHEKLFLKYMERRCHFMEECPQLIFNSGYIETNKGINTAQMRSILFKIMLKEVKMFCHQTMEWREGHSQLIYNFSEGGTSFQFVSCNQKKLTDNEIKDLKAIGVILPSALDANNPKLLHQYLSTAFNISLNKDTNELDLIKKAKYVLTKDFTVKMLNINERKECQMPVIIEGETGVGKTFLVEMLSMFWNDAWRQHIIRQKERVKEILLMHLNVECSTSSKNKEHFQLVQKLRDSLLSGNEEPVSKEEWIKFLNMQCSNSKGKNMHNVLRQEMEFCWFDPALACLDLPPELGKQRDLWELFELSEKSDNTEVLASVLSGVLYGKPKGCFYKLNIHAAMTSSEVIEFFNEVMHHAGALNRKYQKYESFKKNAEQRRLCPAYSFPTITVFLDEVNTSSFPGFLKQAIIDGFINNRPIPSNVFIVAACNPYRGNSVTTLFDEKSKDHWLRPSYYVRPLAPTLQLLTWNYGSLREVDELEYVREKLKMSYLHAETDELFFLAQLIDKGQKLTRRYAADHLHRHAQFNLKDAEKYSTSCVSQRDIQRVFIIYEWLCNWFNVLRKYETETDFHRSIRAVFVAIGITYYFRLNTGYRKEFKEEIDEVSIHKEGVHINFEEALQDELDWMMAKFEPLPPRIAPTQALKENLYAIVICVVNKIPLIIVGPPGSSKTLSFKILNATLRGKHSKSDIFKNESLFPPIDSHNYQCSRRSTSNDVEAVFKRAIKRKKMLEEIGIDSCCVIVLDEAGLAEESHESLKVLHYYLDKSEVAFIGLSNHLLDAAKTNRAVSMYRVESTAEDLKKISDCMFPSASPQSSFQASSFVVEKFVVVYNRVMEFNEHGKISKFFGVRDFVHFLSYLHKQQKHMGDIISPQAVVEALERNFNGYDSSTLNSLIQRFLNEMDINSTEIKRRSDLSVFRASLIDLPEDLSVENQIRFKLVIEECGDNSVVRMLLALQVLDSKSTKILVCTTFPGDPDSVKINTIGSLRYSAAHGNTVVLLHCEDIEESFYDLFNQNYTCFEDYLDKRKRFYANIAIGAQMKMCLVHPKFQCIVVLDRAKIDQTPSAYLNRFEKFSLTHSSVLDEVIFSLPKRLSVILKRVELEVESFVEEHGKENFYGFSKDSLSSLILSFLSCRQTCCFSQVSLPIVENDEELGIILIKYISYHSLEITGVCLSLIDESSINEDLEYIKFIMQSNSQIDLSTSINEIGKNMIPTVVKNALMWLMEESEEDAEIEMNQCDLNTKLVHICFENWVKLSLIKHLLRLMTPEALVMNNHKLPPHFKRLYLEFQHHFSLPAIVNHLNTSNNRCQKIKSGCYIRKVVCFTRSTHYIHQTIPNNYTWRSQDHLSQEQVDEIHKYLMVDPNLIYIHTISNATTSHDLQNTIKDFFIDHYPDILILVADMKEITVDVINHTRILMDTEANTKQQGKENVCSKVMILLLHFPSNRFTRYCYPTVFSHDWEHYYLDSIGTLTEGNINVQSWLYQCCVAGKIFSESSSTRIYSMIETPFVSCKSLIKWIEQLLPEILLKVQIKFLSGWPSDDICKREIWKKFLFEMGVADVLIKRFMNYWTPAKMIELSIKASVVSRTTSTLGITGLIQAEVHHRFIDFIIYTLYFINKHKSLHVLFLVEKDFDCTKEFFLTLLSNIPLPLTLDLCKAAVPSALNIHRLKGEDIQKKRALCFPFFKVVFKFFESILDMSLNEVNSSRVNKVVCSDETVPKNEVDSAFHQSTSIELVTEEMSQQIMKEAKHITYINICLTRLERDERVWKAYVKDAISIQLHRTGSISCDMLYKYFSRTFEGERDFINKLCSFHVHLRFQESASTFTSLLFLLHCIDDIVNFAGLQNDFGVLSFEDLENIQDIFSKIICILFEVIYKISFSEEQTEYDKLYHISDVYFKMINAVTSEKDLQLLSKQTVNMWILVHMSMIVRQLIVTCDKKAEFSTSVEDFLRCFLDCFTNEAKEDKVISMKEVADAIMALAYKTSDVLSAISSSTLPDSACQCIDSLLNLYVIRTRVSHLHDDDFYWILNMINKSNSSVKLSFLHNYLLRILTINSDEILLPNTNVLNYYRAKIGEFLTFQSEQHTKCVVYAPYFYFDCEEIQFASKTSLIYLRERIADIYFNLVVKQLLWSLDNTLTSDLIGLFERMTSLSDETSESLLMSIEREAVAHVLITQIARKLHESNDVELAEICDVIRSVNAALIDEQISIKTKNHIKGHGIAFTVRLLQAYNSSRTFRSMMTTKFDSHLRDFICLDSVQNFFKLEPQSQSSELPLIKFIRENYREKYKIYERIQSAVAKILSIRVGEGVKQISKIAIECYVDGTNMEDTKKQKWTFMMMLLIVIYERVFVAQEGGSKLLARKIEETLYQYIEKDYLRVMIFFANPNHYNGSKQVPEDVQHLESFLVESIHDPERRLLLDCLVQMLAVIIGCPRHASHFWSYLCCPNEKCADLISSDLVHPYNASTDLPLTTLSYINLGFTTRSSFNLQSALLVQMINFGILCLATLSNPSLADTLKGTMFPPDMLIADFCLERLKDLWDNEVMNVLNINGDEKEQLVQKYLQQFYKCCLERQLPDQNDITLYEKKLHEIFLSSWKETKMIKRYEALSPALGATLRHLESNTLPLHYSRNALAKMFIYKMLSSTDYHNEKNKLFILHQFMLQRSALNTGGRLLPHLVYFFFFFHEKWSYSLTEEEAQERNIRQYLEEYLSENLPNKKSEILTRFTNMISQYNDWASITKTKPVSEAFCITEYLCCGGTLSVLYRAIDIIIKQYNAFIGKIRNHCSKVQSLCYVEQACISIPISEIDATTCCIGTSMSIDDVEDIFHLIQKHSLSLSTLPQNELDDTFLPEYMTNVCFDLEKLQHDVLQEFLIHKHLISERKIKKDFQFLKRKETNRKSLTVYSTSVVNQDMMEKHFVNHHGFMTDFSENLTSEFMYLFHSLHYDGLLKVLNGLSLVLKHLLQALSVGKDVKEETTEQFIMNHALPPDMERDVLKTIGIEKQTAVHYHSGVNEDQYTFLCNLKVCHVFNAVNILVQWMECGVYDFCHLPVSMKVKLEKSIISELQERIRSKEQDPKIAVQDLIDMLVICECQVLSKVFENTEFPMCEVITMYDAIRHEKRWKKTLQILPKSVQVQHYVYLHIELRRYHTDLMPDEAKSSDLSQVRKVSPSLDTRKDILSVKFEPKPRIVVPTINVSPVFERKKQELPDAAKQTLEDSIIPDLSDKEKCDMKETAKKTSVEDMISFLEDARFQASVIDTIKELSLTGEMLYEAMDDDDQLRSIEIHRPHEILKFRVLFKRYLLGKKLKIAELFTVADVAAFFRASNQMDYAETFEKNGIDGEMLWLATTDNNVLKDLGVTGILMSKIKVKFRNKVLESFKNE